MRKGRLTASRKHDVYTKVNTITQSQGVVTLKTTALVEKNIIPRKAFSN